MATSIRRVSLYFVLGIGTYGGYSFYNKFIASTKKLEKAPSNSLLEKQCYNTFDADTDTFEQPAFHDCYQFEKKSIKLKNDKTFNNMIDKEFMISELISKSFYASSIFSMEKYLLKKICLWNKIDDENVLNTKYNIGQIYGIWKVGAKTNNEIILEWYDKYSIWDKYLNGITYLSANITPSKSDNDDDCIDVTFEFGSGTLKPRQLPFIVKPFLTFHSIYSRMLLVSTAEQFVSIITECKSI